MVRLIKFVSMLNFILMINDVSMKQIAGFH